MSIRVVCMYMYVCVCGTRDKRVRYVSHTLWVQSEQNECVL